MADGNSADQLELLEEALTDTTAGKLGALAADVDLSKEILREKAREESAEILAGVASAWERWRTAKRDLAVMRLDLPGSAPGRAWRGMRLSIGQVDPRDFLGATIVSALVVGLFAGLTIGASTFSAVASRTLVAAAIPIGLALLLRLFVALLPPRPTESQLRLASTEAVGAERTYRARLADAVSAWVRSRINVSEGLTYGTVLRFKDSSGLGEVDDPSHEIPTEARDRLSRLIDRMPGGAIGLAGTRGAGKSTLMRSICGGADTDKEVLGVVVDAPVQYDSREFILHLFAKLCGAVIGPDRTAALRGWRRPFDLVGRTSGGRVGYHPAVGLVVGLTGAWLVLSSIDASFGGISGSLIVGSLLLLLGYVLGMNSVIRDGERIRQMLGRGDRRAPVGDGEEDVADIADIAEQRLRQIWFQQSFSSGWSGSLKIPVGLEGGVSASAELSEQQLSLPDIVDLLREFLELVSGDREVRIGIDELDKMADDDAQQFLNEIKAIFRVPKCFFFVSISEDAMSMFERRGLPIRDVFDSSFDAVQHVPHLQFDDSKALLDRRIVDLPVSFAALLHCMSSGLPRDLIRTARDLVALPVETTLDDAAKILVDRALSAKTTATKVQARRLAFGGHVTMLVRWLELLAAANCEPRVLLDVCRDSELRYRQELAALPSSEYLREDEGQLQDMATQVVAFAYYAATLLQIFEGMDDPPSIDAVLNPDGDAGMGSPRWTVLRRPARSLPSTSTPPGKCSRGCATTSGLGPSPIRAFTWTTPTPSPRRECRECQAPRLAARRSQRSCVPAKSRGRSRRWSCSSTSFTCSRSASSRTICSSTSTPAACSRRWC